MLNVSELMQPEIGLGAMRDAPGGRRAERPNPDGNGAICIHHSGRAFLASVDQAAIFLRRAQHIISHRQTELVPLLHADGVDLLFVTARTPLQVHDSRDRSITVGHGAARRGAAPAA